MTTRTGAGVRGGRVNQKARTRAAIVEAVQDLARAGAEITIQAVAKAALVSEATAYRYFPDLVSLLREADAGVWPDPAQALAPVASSDNPVERVGYATEVLLAGVLARQSLVRAMIAASVTRPDVAATRPGHRFALIERALAPLAGADPQALTQLKQGLAVVMSAEALFVLTDLCGLSPGRRGRQRRPHRVLAHRGRDPRRPFLRGPPRDRLLGVHRRGARRPPSRPASRATRARPGAAGRR